METKICTKCNLDKPLTEYYKDSQKSSGYRPDCKDCNKIRTSAYAKNNRQKMNFNNMKYKTGITKEQYEEILNQQNDLCRICNITEEENGKRFSIDHCHTTGYIRGLLCNKCNQGLGYFNDDTDKLHNAIIYLNNNLETEEIRYGKQ